MAKRKKKSSSDRKNIRKRLRKFKELAADLFHYSTYEDSQIIDFVMLPGVGLSWKTGNPLWIQIIGPPGSGKTAHVTFYEEWEEAKFVSRLIRNSLISGFRPEGKLDEDPSLLKQLDGKLLVVKDFTCILQGPREERDAVVGQLRDAYDGKASRALGNVGLMEYEARFNIVLAVTNIIDGFHSVNTQLGERFISRREVVQKRKPITEAAFDNAMNNTFGDRLQEVKYAFADFMNELPDIPLRKIKWKKRMKNRAVLAADFIASCRSHVIREKNGRTLASRPSPEVGTRLVTQVAQTVAGFCIINGIAEVNQDAWNFGGARVLRDTLPVSIAWTLSKIYDISSEFEKCPKFTVKDILPLTRLGWHTTTQILMDLHHNGILDASYVGKTGRKGTRYVLRDDSYNIIHETKLFQGYESQTIDPKTIFSRSNERRRSRSKPA